MAVSAGRYYVYPWPWAVPKWIDGETPIEGRLTEPELIAHDLASFINAC